MTNPMIRIHNTDSDEILDREMTDAEFAEFTAEAQVREAEEAAKVAKAAAKQAVLEKLGLTAEELAAALA